VRGRKGGVPAQRQLDSGREPAQPPIVQERGGRLVQLSGGPPHPLIVGGLRQQAYHRRVAAERLAGEGIDTEQRGAPPAILVSWGFTS
jgi:hypothetical protein